jgi:hypothetical protein
MTRRGSRRELEEVAASNQQPHRRGIGDQASWTVFLHSLGLNANDVGVYLNSRWLMERKPAGIGVGDDQRMGVFRLIGSRDRMPSETWAAWVLAIDLSEGQIAALKALSATSDL